MNHTEQTAQNGFHTVSHGLHGLRDIRNLRFLTCKMGDGDSLAESKWVLIFTQSLHNK